MFCGQCGTKNVEQNDFCTNCGRRFFTYKVKIPLQKEATTKKEQQPEHSVNNWTELYQSMGKYSKEKQEKKRLVKEEREKLEKKRIAKMKRQEKKRLVQKEKEKKRLEKKDKKENLEKSVASPILPQQSTFSFSGSRLPTFLIAGFVLGFITFAIIGLSSSSSDSYGCTICDPFHPDYDGPPPIEYDLYVPEDFYYDDGYYDDFYYDDGYYP